MSPVLKKVYAFMKVPMRSFRRPKNFKDNLVRVKRQPLQEKAKGMFCCGKTRCKVCNYFKPSNSFIGNVDKRSFHINHSFDCDSCGFIYLITCKRCGKQYVGSTITSFRIRFCNHKSSLNWYGRGQRGICGEHLYAHFWEDGHKCLKDANTQIIDVTNVRDTTYREAFWIEKWNSCLPLGLNALEIS